EKGLEESQRYEPLEIRGISQYLLAKTQPFEFASRPKGVTEKRSAERGKKLFETRGCLACHTHSDFPKATMNQGPDLSRIGAKLDRDGNPDGGKWLYSWLRNPSAYHPRTLMPNLLLDPITGQKGVSDPAADLAEFLLGSRGQDAEHPGGWKPTGVPSLELSDKEQDSLRELALLSLREKAPRRQAEDFLKYGIPESRRNEFKGDEVELIGTPSSPQELLAMQLNYVGRRAITKYGCSGCHDVPGFEDAKPIGTGLADWGRKAPDKLAFELIANYVTGAHGNGAHGNGGHGESKDKAEGKTSGHDIKFEDMDRTEGYFLQALLGHQREGFIWQKLRAPRSYDFQKTQNKGYNERLRMPKFNLSGNDVESIVTFVLGLVAEPPASQYVYKPSPRRQAIVEGSKVLDKFNCTGCHAVQLDRWKLAYSPDAFPEPAPVKDYSFLEPHPTPQEVKA